MSRLLAKSYNREIYRDGPPEYALLTQHSRDVGQACRSLFDAIGKIALANLDLRGDEAEHFSEMLIASGWLQDLGKANSHFQTMVGGRFEERQLLRHETISALLVVNKDLPFRAWLREKFSDADLLAVSWAAVGHHRKFSKSTKPSDSALTQSVDLAHADFRRILVDMANDLSLKPPPTVEKTLSIAPLRGVGDLIADAGLMAIQKEFRKSEENFQDSPSRRRLALLKGLGVAADVAASAVAKREKTRYSLASFVDNSLKVGLTPDQLADITGRFTRHPNFCLRDFQRNVAASDDYLTFAQAGCGSGKSLAAYLWAQKWCKRFEAEGRTNFRLFFCLPTTGTATEHFKDYALESGIPADLINLTHSRYSVDLQTIAATTAQEEVGENSKNAALDVLRAEQDKIESLKLWSTPLVACTADTVLGLMVNARRSVYSLPAIMCGAIVFDEIHAFDEQMFGHLLVFLKNFPNLPILLMTASLPQERIDAIRRVRPNFKSVAGDESFEVLERYSIKAIDNEAVIWQEIEKCLRDGGKVLWVRNRVDWANETYTDCQEFCEKNLPTVSVDVYHSRLRYEDRSSRHRRVIDEFKSDKKGAILVATQVAEMSLDLSADLLITDIAPIPALIQRMGRLNRRLRPDTPIEQRRVKPALICSLPNQYKNSELPYEADEIATAVEWVAELQKRGEGLSQRDLAKVFGQFDSKSEFDTETAEERAVFFSGLWQTYPAATRAEGYTINVILESDFDEWRRNNGSREPSDDFLRRREVAIPFRDEILQWRDFGGLRVAPRVSVGYDYGEKGTGAEWLKPKR